MNNVNKYCAECGSKTQWSIPEDDHTERDVCTSCGYIHYVNPKVITGALPVYQGKILLCKRNIEPRKGYWTLPAGFMECNESTEEGAARETWEESEATLTNMQFYRVYDIPSISQVYVFYLAELTEPKFKPTPESIDVALFNEDDIPWSDIAFKVVSDVLKSYFADRKASQFSPKHEVIRRPTKR